MAPALGVGRVFMLRALGSLAVAGPGVLGRFHQAMYGVLDMRKDDDAVIREILDGLTRERGYDRFVRSLAPPANDAGRAARRPGVSVRVAAVVGMLCLGAVAGAMVPDALGWRGMPPESVIDLRGDLAAAARVKGYDGRKVEAALLDHLGVATMTDLRIRHHDRAYGWIHGLVYGDGHRTDLVPDWAALNRHAPRPDRILTGAAAWDPLAADRGHGGGQAVPSP